MIDSLGWLQVSDFHFVAQGDEFSQRVATQALLDDVTARAHEGPRPSFVVVTGDVAYSGQPAEYVRAADFLRELSASLEVPTDRFYFVPGNHDVDRDRHILAYAGARELLTSQAAVDHLLGKADNAAALIERQRAFWDFVEEFTGGQSRQPTDDGLGYVAALDIDGFKVCIIGLNSAWLSGGDGEEMRLLVGERQLINALELVRGIGAQIQIALAHHPISWLHEWDQVACHQRLLPEVDIFHRGHLHHAEISWGSVPSRPCLMVAAGSGHATRHYENSYNLVEVDLGGGRCMVRPFRYHPAEARYVPAPQETAALQLRGELPGSLADLAEVIGGLPDAARFAWYLAALLVGHQAEVPAVIDGRIEFLAIDAAQELAAPEDLAETAAFLSLRNLLRLYDPAMGLEQRVAEHGVVLEAFGRHLASLGQSDEPCAQQLAMRSRSGPNAGRTSSPSSQPHTMEYLMELQRTGDYETLQVQAPRYIMSADPDLALLAKRCLAEALMHSDEGPKRAQGYDLARSLLSNPGDSVHDHLLAAAAAETVGDDAEAVRITDEALARWPTHGDLRAFARRLVLRTGDPTLRNTLDAGGPA